MSHKADAVLSAYRAADDNIVIFVKGRLTEKEGAGEFSLLVPKAALTKIKEERRSEHWGDNISGTGGSFYGYDAMIGPPSELKLSDWTPMKVEKEKAPVVWMAEPNDYMPAQAVPVIYVLPRATNAANGDGLRNLWGAVHIVYVDTNPDGTVFRCSITPKAQRIEKTRNGIAWLPVTVPLDVATLPAQALWGALFVITLAGEK